MANPFGELVNDDKLDQMSRYVDQPKTQEDRAREAMYLINDKAKNSDAANYVQSVKDHYGNGVSALCVIYNGTGDTIHYVADHDWYGYIGRTLYPVEIGNGQWAGFLHVHRTSEPSGSEAAVVYRGKNRNGDDRDFLIAWNVPWGWSSNSVYCAVGEVNGFQSRWDDIYNKLNNGKKRHTSDAEECRLVVDIASGTSPVFRAVLETPYSS
ncbi:23 kDa jasmonate-induced protein-like [Silene latifolia]|uniref:23 kDa jasmonate-induced protein-like n=1 Tax=Silene latifolia TaxID=37657 RepID=UPI003D77CA36